MALGKAVVNITANLAPLKRGLVSARLLVSRSMKRFVSGVAGGIASIVRRTMASIVTVVRRTVKITLAAFVAIGIASVKFASDAAEANNLFEVSFADLTKEMEDWTRSLAGALRLNETNVKGYVGTFNLMLVSMGFGADAAAKMSKRLTELTVDLASLRNLSFEDAFTKITGGLVGEIRPLRRVGVLIDENTVKTAALVAGIIKEGEELTQTQKVMGRFQAMIKQTSKDTGDFAKTRDEGNNVFKTFAEILKTTGETIGAELLPPVRRVILAMREWLVGSQSKISAWAKVVGEGMDKVITRAVNFVRTFMEEVQMKGLIETIKSRASEAMQAIKDVIRENRLAIEEVMLDIGALAAKSFLIGLGTGIKGLAGVFKQLATDAAISLGGAISAGGKLFVANAELVAAQETAARKGIFLPKVGEP